MLNEKMNTQQYAVDTVTISYERPVNNLYSTLVQLGRHFLLQEQTVQTNILTNILKLLKGVMRAPRLGSEELACQGMQLHPPKRDRQTRSLLWVTADKTKQAFCIESYWLPLDLWLTCRRETDRPSSDHLSCVYKYFREICSIIRSLRSLFCEFLGKESCFHPDIFSSPQRPNCHIM